MKITLRDYQQDINDSIDRSEKRGIRRQLVVAMTGLGKTISLIFFILRQLKRNNKVLILCDQSELVRQWKRAIHSVDSSITIGIEKADQRAKLTDQIVIATPQTLGRKGVKRIKRFKPDHFRCTVIDESHRSISETWFRVLNYFGFGNENFTDGNLLVGTTATPFRTDGQSLNLLYDDVVANYDVHYAMREGWLTDIVLYDVESQTDLSAYTNQGEIDEAVNNEERNLLALKAYTEHAPNEQMLAYCASVEHAYQMVELFNKHGVPSAVIEANTPDDERKQILQDYKDNKIKVIGNHSTMTTGIDLPETSVIMLLRPISSKLLLTQIIGRGIRPSSSAHIDLWLTKEERLRALELSDKPYCKVIDLYDKVGNHNFAHLPSLFGLNNQLKTKERKQFFKEVVEPIDRAKKEHNIDITAVLDPDDIKLVVKNRKIEIKSLSLSPEIAEFTARSWVTTSNGYEIVYSKDNKVLMIEKDSVKSDLLDKEEYHLLEYDTKSKLTKKLQTFGSLAGAFNIADEYADQQNYDAKFLRKGTMTQKPVTEKQLALLEKFFVYKNGYSKFDLLNERYDNGVRKIYWKPTGEILDREKASLIISDFFKK